MTLTVTVSRPGHKPRAEDFFPGSIFTPTTLLYSLLTWLDEGKRWDEIASDEVRVDVARDLRVLADIIEVTSGAASEADYFSNWGSGVSNQP